MKTNNSTIALKALLVLTIILVVESLSNSILAQGRKYYGYHRRHVARRSYFAENYQLGFEGTFGTKTFSINSNIKEINHLNVVEQGGTFGVTAAVNGVRVKVRQGYYYSSSQTVYTVDEVRSALVFNFYPIQLLGGKSTGFQPYVTTGIARDLFKMYGFYGNDIKAPGSVVNYSVSEAPYLGKINTVQAGLGAGLEYSIKNPGHYVSLFAEVKYSKPVAISTSDALFKGTSVSDHLAVSVGVCFGYNR